MNVLEKAIINNQKYQKQMRKEKYTRPELFKIIEHFMTKYKLIGYGGMAINSLLPLEKQFYTDIDVPDYDFFSINALNDAKELADIYYKKGFLDVEAKSGQHHGTYKVYVNFMPVADISFLPKNIYNSLMNESIKVAGILYAPPNFLRMSMYLELSRPVGDVSRWEKVLKRLTLLNKYYLEECLGLEHHLVMFGMYFKGVLQLIIRYYQQHHPVRFSSIQ